MPENHQYMFVWSKKEKKRREWEGKEGKGTGREREEREGRVRREEERGGEETGWKELRKVGKQEKRNIQDRFKWPLKTISSSKLHVIIPKLSMTDGKTWWLLPDTAFSSKESCPFYSLIHHGWANIFPYISPSHLAVFRSLRKCLYHISPYLFSSFIWKQRHISTLIIKVTNIKLMLAINRQSNGDDKLLSRKNKSLLDTILYPHPRM